MKKLINVLTDASLFRRAYIICLFFCNVSFIQVPFYACLILLFLWGAFLVFYREYKYHTFQKMRFGLWLMAFMLFSTLTAIIHISDNFMYNLVIQMHVAICFFVFYAMHTEKHLNFRREMYHIARFVVYATTIIGIAGLACLMAGISFEVMSIKFIIYENRFTGIYSNPNTMGFISVVAIVCAHMLTKADFIQISGIERVSRIWLGSCVAVNGMSLFLSDSNGAIVLMIGYVVVFAVYKVFGAERKLSSTQIITKLVACVLVGAFLVASVFFVRFICQSGFTQILNAVDQTERSITSAEDDTLPDNVAESDPFSATDRITFSHENKNLDSGRFKLWRQAIQMFRVSPLFGVGKGNIYTYGETMFEHGVAFSDLYGKMLSAFVTDFHNAYATILVCSGVFGFALFSIFGLRFAKHITIHVFKDSSLKESVLPCMYAFLCSYLAYAFIEKALLYDISFTVLFFWLIMGYVSFFLCRYEPDHSRGIYLFRRRLRRSLL